MQKEFYAKGKRSVVYKTTVNGKPAIIKEEKKGIGAIERIRNEARWLKRMNKEGIGPKFISEGDGFVICELIEGERITDCIKKSEKKKIKKILLETLEQCRKMDNMLVSKEEMHNPYKHIIIGKGVKMIDFERCHNTEKPKNITQFCQFITSSKLTEILKEKGFKINKEKLKESVKAYKSGYKEENFIRIKKNIN